MPLAEIKTAGVIIAVSTASDADKPSMFVETIVVKRSGARNVANSRCDMLRRQRGNPDGDKEEASEEIAPKPCGGVVGNRRPRAFGPRRRGHGTHCGPAVRGCAAAQAKSESDKGREQSLNGYRTASGSERDKDLTVRRGICA